jgi:GlpG protein
MPPPVTLVILVVCVATFLALNFLPDAERSRVSEAMAPEASSIWSGAAWGLLTTAFVHLAIWHLAFNMIWAVNLGRLVEPMVGSARYLALIVASAFVASGWQLLVSDATGIGFSGVVYAVFGYVLARRKSHPAYAAFVNPSTVRWMLGWLVLCVVLTLAKVWNVGNAAHASGLAFGYLLGTALERSRWRVPAFAGMAVLVVGMVMSVVYMPWSKAWRAKEVLHQIANARVGAERGDPHAAALYGSTLMRWPTRRTEGMKWLRFAAEHDDAEGMNGLAWSLATVDDDALRNGAEAVAWATKAVAAARSANNEDTLAAAYAESDRWDEAVATQKQAIADGEDDTSHGRGDPHVLFKMKEHLARLERHEKIRD